jgi:tetraacyldisaccharide 4'-kinase
MKKLPAAWRALLWPLSAAYGAFVRRRAALYAKGRLKQKRLRGIVVSVGNLTVGGTGKTPMVIWLAEHFLRKGKRVAILSRGYRGAGGTSDEIEVMKRHLDGRVAFGVGKNRCESAEKLEAEKIEVFLLDDGFQHLQLARDVDIVLVDGTRPLEGERLLPSGRLREPVSALSRADIVVVTRAGERMSIEARARHANPIFYARTRLQGFRRLGNGAAEQSLGETGPGPCFAFCGIGNPEAFFSDLKRWHVDLAGTLTFRDHHRYTESDVRSLEEAAAKAGASSLVTTEKDAWNLRGLHFPRLSVYVCVITLEPDSESEFIAAIGRNLAPRSEAKRQME